MTTSFKKLKTYFLISLFLAGCTTYRLSSDEKWRNYFPTKDELVITDKEFKEKEFNVNDYHNPKDEIRYVCPNHITELSQRLSQDLLVVFYNPSCDISNDLILAKFIDEHNIPCVFISIVNNQDDIERFFSKVDLTKKNMLVYPTLEDKENLILKKRGEFVSTLNQDLLVKYKDHVVFTRLLLVRKSGEVLSDIEENPGVGYNNHDYLVSWIKRYFP